MKSGSFFQNEQISVSHKKSERGVKIAPRSRPVPKARKARRGATRPDLRGLDDEQRRLVCIARQALQVGRSLHTAQNLEYDVAGQTQPIHEIQEKCRRVDFGLSYRVLQMTKQPGLQLFAFCVISAFLLYSKNGTPDAPYAACLWRQLRAREKSYSRARSSEAFKFSALLFPESP